MATTKFPKGAIGLDDSMVQFGKIESTSFASGKYTLTFPTEFGGEPVVFASPNAGAIDSVTTVGMTAVSKSKVVFQLVRCNASAVTTPNLIVRWLAIGPKPTA